MNEKRYAELAGAGAAELEVVFATSKWFDPETLLGWEWRGWNHPAWTSWLGMRKFIKGFFDGDRGIEGYTIPVAQNRFADPWLHKQGAESPERFGFCRVSSADAGAVGARYPKAVYLDYGAGARDARWRPERVLRDYLVQPDPADGDILLGKAYLALGPLRVPSNFFILARLRKTPWKP